MIERINKLFGVMALAIVLIAEGVLADYIWWTVDPPSEVEVETLDGQSIVTAESLGVTDARIKVSGGSAGSDTYLSLAYIVEDEDGNLSIAIGTPPGGTVQYVSADGGAGEVFADLGTYAASEYAFQVELGQWDDAGQTWNALAESGLATFDQLYLMGGLNPGENYITSDPLETPGSVPWNPDYYRATKLIPEPGTGLLIILGCAIVALKRKTT